MKTLFFLLLVITTNNAMKCSDEANKDFEIKSATKQNFYLGRKESGWYEKYKITVIPAYSSEVMSFDTLWINGKPYACAVYQEGKKVKNNTFGKGDEITISINIHHQYHENLPILKRTPPIEYNGEALLVYTLKKKTKFLSIKEFEKLPNVNYP